MPPILKAYADTTVSVHKTQAELAKLLSRYGVRRHAWQYEEEDSKAKLPGLVSLGFELPRDGQVMLYRVDVRYQYIAGPRGGNQGTTMEQAARALYWHVKHLLEAVEFGIVTMETAFLAHLVTNSGEVLADRVERENLLPVFVTQAPRLALPGGSDGQ